MSILKKFAGQTLIYGLSTIVARLLNFVLTPLFVRQYSTAVYGIFTKMYAWAAMVNALLAFGMETTFFRYLQKVEEKDKPKVFDASFLITLITSAVFLIHIFLFADPIAAWLNKGRADADYKLYVQLFGLILVADALAVVPFAKLRAEGRPLYFGLLKLINIFVFVGLNLFFILLIPYLLDNNYAIASSFEGWYRAGWIGYVFIANLVASVITLLMLLPQMMTFRFRADRSLIKSMFAYSFPILIANISFIINEHIDKTLLPRLLPEGVGDRDLGIYGAVSKIAVFLSIFVQAFRLGAEPFFFSYSKNANAKQTYALIMQYFVIAMMIVMVGLSVNIEWLKYFIKGSSKEMQDQYWSGLYIVPILLFNYVMLGIYMNLSVWYKLSDQTRYGLYISGIGALITVVLCFALIPSYSYLGATITTSVTYLVMVGLSYFWGQKNYPIPYRVGKMLGYMLLGAVLVFIQYYFLERSFILGNILLIAYMAFIAWREKGPLLDILRSRG